MTTIQPRGEALRRAVRFISDQLENDPERPIMALVEAATLRFDLNPSQAEYLMRFYREVRS